MVDIAQVFAQPTRWTTMLCAPIVVVIRRVSPAFRVSLVVFPSMRTR